MKRIILTLFILIFLIPCTVCVAASVTEFDADFDTAESTALWNGAFFDSAAAFEGDGGALVINPFGSVRAGLVTHVLELQDTVYLEAGKIYSLSGYVLNPMAAKSDTPRAKASLEKGSKTVIVSVSGAGDSWEKFSADFYAYETGDFNLSIHFENADENFGIFTDSISFHPIDAPISGVKLIGPEEILVPAASPVTISYTPVLVTDSGRYVYLLSYSALHAYISDFPGAEFDSSLLTLTLSPNTSRGDIIIEYAVKDAPGIAPGSLTVTVTDNIIDNSDMETDAELLWQGSELDVVKDGENTCLVTYTDNYENYGYHSYLTYLKPQLLVKDTLYVLRARVKSSLSASKPVFAANTVTENGSSVIFNIKDISGTQWYDISAAYVPTASGIYELSLNLFSSEPCYIYADDIKLCIEAPSPDYITIHAPGNIALPDVETAYPINAYVRNQLGEIIDSETCTITLKGDVPGIRCDGESKLLYVSPDALSGTYTLVAQSDAYPSITHELLFTVGADFIGDGGFENTKVNELWMVNSPYPTVFNMASNADNRYADIACDGDYFILLSNSYVHFSENTPYTFTCNIRPSTDVSVTVFLDSLSGEKLPLLQFSVPARSSFDIPIPPQVFLSEYDSCGRLFFYVQSDSAEAFDAIFDNMVMKKAIIKVASPTISGDLTVNGFAKALFGFYSSIDPAADDSGCVVNWYVSDDSDKNFVQLSENGRYIYFDTSFSGKYVYFDVTPVCPITGFSGDTLKSGVVRVDYAPLSADTSPPNNDTVPTPDTPSSDVYFSDIDTHWAKGSIYALAKLGIVNGTSGTSFSPERLVTRAEAAKMIAGAFNYSASSSAFYSDVSSEDWFFPYISALSEHNIVKGVGEGRFLPNDYITREELFCILIRVYENRFKDDLHSTPPPYKDINSVSDWAYDAVSKAAHLNIIQGDENGFIHPTNNSTRAEAAVLINRMRGVLSL